MAAQIHDEKTSGNSVENRNIGQYVAAICSDDVEDTDAEINNESKELDEVEEIGIAVDFDVVPMPCVWGEARFGQVVGKGVSRKKGLAEDIAEKGKDENDDIGDETSPHGSGDEAP